MILLVAAKLGTEDLTDLLFVFVWGSGKQKSLSSKSIMDGPKSAVYTNTSKVPSV